MSKFFLETTNLKKNFVHTNRSITLFENLNLKIQKGELVALVGPSGSGKSSLLHLLALLDEPTKGKIIIDKQETKNLSIEQKDELRRKSISIIFQDNNLLNDFTAIENVMMPLLIKGEKNKIIVEKAKRITAIASTKGNQPMAEPKAADVRATPELPSTVAIALPASLKM